VNDVLPVVVSTTNWLLIMSRTPKL
jgi:hypothetical protein